MSWRTIIGVCLILAFATICGILLMLAQSGDVQAVKEILGWGGMFVFCMSFFALPWITD